MWCCSGILCLALLSTFSTGAIAAMAVLLVTVYFEKKLYRSPLGKLLTAVAFILGAAFLAWLFIRKPPLYTTLLYMVQKVTPGNPSFDDRFESIYINLHLLSFRPRLEERLPTFWRSSPTTPAPPPFCLPSWAFSAAGSM